MDKYLGIDYGEKRVGIAISDLEGKVAFPKIVLSNDSELLSKIDKFCKENQITKIVIGESKDYKGEDNKISPQIISFKRDLGNLIKLPIFLEPEFMTSMQVEKTFGKTDMLDASAATIILQTFMDKEVNRQLRRSEELELGSRSSDQSVGGKNKFTGKINYDDFSKVEMKVGKILEASIVEGSEKLYKLSVDFDESEPRQIVSGIAKFFPEPNILINKKVVFVTNLEPRPLMGLLSNGMILAAKSGDKLALVEMPDFIEIGTKLG